MILTIKAVADEPMKPILPESIFMIKELSNYLPGLVY